MSRENPNYLERNPGVGHELQAHLAQAEAGERQVGTAKQVAGQVKGSFRKGGKVKATGKYLLHKNEVVLPADKKAKAKMLVKALSGAGLSKAGSKTSSRKA